MVRNPFSSAQESPRLHEGLRKHQLRVLLVEDSEDDALLLLREIDRGGFETTPHRVWTAAALDDALSNANFDVILCDYVLPSFSGLEALEMVARRSIDVPLIIVSGHVDEDTAVRSMRAGAKDYVMKDNLRRLVPAIRRELAEASERRLELAERKRLENESDYRLRSLTALYEGAERLTTSFNEEQLAQIVATSCLDIFGAQYCWIGRVEQHGSIVELASLPFVLQEPVTLRIDRDSGPIAESIRRKVPIPFNTIDDAPGVASLMTSEFLRGMKSFAASPLEARGEVCGLLLVGSNEHGFFGNGSMELFRSYSNQVANALSNAHLYAEATQRLDRLAAMRTVEGAVSSSLDLDKTLEVVLRVAFERSKVDAVVVRLLDSNGEALVVAGQREIDSNSVSLAPIILGEGLAGLAAKEKRVVIADSNRRDLLDHYRAEGFQSGCALPLLSKGRCFGVLELYNLVAAQYGAEWLDFVEAIATEAGIAIENSAILRDLQRKKDELAEAYEETIEGWARALELRDMETEGHARRVTDVTVELALRIGIPDQDLEHIRRGALLHDIGKLGIPDSILLKPGPLTEEERELINQHTIYAKKLLDPIPFLAPAMDIPYSHHEKWDGTGYPEGLSGEDIPLAARAFAVVDVWDALGSDRPYRKAWSSEKIREYLVANAGTHFDPKVVDEFCRLMDETAVSQPAN